MIGLLGRLRRLPWFTLIALGILLCFWVIIPNGAMDKLAASGQPVPFLVTVRSRTPGASAWLLPCILLTALWFLSANLMRGNSTESPVEVLTAVPGALNWFQLAILITAVILVLAG